MDSNLKTYVPAVRTIRAYHAERAGEHTIVHDGDKIVLKTEQDDLYIVLLPDESCLEIRRGSAFREAWKPQTAS